MRCDPLRCIDELVKATAYKSDDLSSNLEKQRMDF